MDFKGITWIGNIYQKFEAMCLEVEEIMYEDTVRYVDNQVQTVGASFKKLYSEVVQDLLPQTCTESEKVAASDLSLNSYVHTEAVKRPAKMIKEDPIEVDNLIVDNSTIIIGKSKNGLHRRRVVSGKECSKNSHNSHEMAGYRISGSTTSVSANCISRLPSFDERRGSWGLAYINEPSAVAESALKTSAREIRNNILGQDVAAPETSMNCSASDKILSIESVGQKQEQSSCISSGDISPEHIWPSDDCSVRLIEDENTVEPRMGIIEQYEQPELEEDEACVLVEEDNLQVSQGVNVKHKSYKKKIREAFSSKMGSRRKREYQRLATLHRDQISQHEDTEAMTDFNSEEVRGDGCPESEWELL